ncbi:hypothetical protein SAMN02745113_01218 [Nitrosomonas europaea]|nr:hypothetical protein SAMN02745113_01218 [Nitrosomonas europaea]
MICEIRIVIEGFVMMLMKPCICCVIMVRMMMIESMRYMEMIKLMFEDFLME